ncbi:MAG: N-acetylmuramoyl-L-alanine amidase [Oscillospiraceae bacterium]|nr:N-acetylmuramoyl-L-alanine amidase [Oscillospiraceae bacterium]
MKIKHKQFNFILPLLAVFVLTLSCVIALMSVGGEETVYYFNQLNFTPDPKTICIDPGHGGSSSGATGEGGKRLEKNDTLRLSLLVRDELESRGYTVVMTRDTDSDISLEERCNVANKSKAALFVSIHRNSTTGKGQGCEMWIHSTNPSDDRLLAENILQNLALTGADTSRGIHTGYREGANQNYYVNRCSKMPSVLAEIGFITSEKDNTLFDEDLDALAVAIADGIEMTLLEMNGE